MRDATRSRQAKALLFMACLAFGCQGTWHEAYAQPDPAAMAMGALRARAQTSPSRYAAGELIVKLTEDVGAQLEAALESGATPTTTGLAWLDTLNAEYGVTAIERLFRHQQDPDVIKERFPERARRAPPGITPPTLRYTYTFTLGQEVNVPQAAAAYAEHEAVEYAEPNFIATIHSTILHLNAP